eukprot:scaffold195401_cov41-Attheya_sp.AAC.1
MKWGVDMVTRGGELLIATRCSSADDGRQKRFEQVRSGVHVVILYRTNKATVPIILATAPYQVSSLRVEAIANYVPVRTAPSSARRLQTVGWNPESVINRTLV